MAERGLRVWDLRFRQGLRFTSTPKDCHKGATDVIRNLELKGIPGWPVFSGAPNPIVLKTIRDE